MTPEYPPHVGGVGRSARRIAKGLSAAGLDVTVFKPLTRGDVAADFPREVDGLTVHAFPPDLFAGIRAIGREDRRRPFDLFHGFTLMGAYACLSVVGGGTRPIVASIRGIDGVAFDDAATTVLRRATWITSVSRASLARAAAVADVSGRSSFVANGIETRAFPSWEPSEENAGVVGTVATFRRKKNIPLLARAYSRLPRTLRRRLLLVGDFYDADVYDVEMRDETCRVVLESQIESEVELTGYVEPDAVPDQLARMRVFVLSSDNEGLPNAVLEAAAAGLPIVATAVDGVKDIFVDRHDALLVEPGDVEQLASAIRSVLEDLDCARALSRAARATAARLTPAAELRQYLDLYGRLLLGVPANAVREDREVAP
jgi:L-malate glycosyltransferase